ncbi:PLP-dependent aminotransferase family protein, partial [Allorhizocola rhizosphaerae]|uniref:MocR-like pyridoxine biosynthesis transcription factor PdxR n=1 Tax=Allorhizocola rhizosphaerae TaxID=1872709 RepID=UPI001FEB2D95
QSARKRADQFVDLHLEIDRSAGAVAAQVASGLREAIRRGRLAAGTRLPASRQLAADLGVSRGVVVEAYEQLTAEGFLSAQVGSGTIVAADASAARAEEGMPGGGALADYELRPGTPDLKLFPRTQWLSRYRQTMLTLAHDQLRYPDPAGALAARQELAGYLNRVRAAQASPENLVVTGGVAMAQSLLMRALAKRGRAVVAVEDPSGVEYRMLLESAGATVVPVPVDEHGLIAAALPAGATAVILTPAHQYPLGYVLSPQRRHELLAWSERTGGIVIEDDYDAEFRFDRESVGSMRALVPERVVLTGSVSKSLSPAVRLGWLVAPPWLARAVREERRMLDLGSPVIEQHVLARFIADGGYDRHLRRVRRIYRRRRDAMVQALPPSLKPLGISAGLHLCVPVESDVELAERAWDSGVGVLAVTPMRVEPGPGGLVLCFAREPEARLVEAVRLLRRLLG